MIYTDLNELKVKLDLDPNDHSEDKKINFLVEQASQLIEEIINRPGMSYKSRTEYYSGTGTQKLLLRSRPVYTTPTIQVYYDNGGFFGAASGAFDVTTTALTYGVDFALKVDQEDGTSRSGMLIRMNDFWFRPQIRQVGFLSPFIGEDFGSYKIIYTAGYTVDNLPAAFRMACELLVARLLYLFPLGMEIGSESYEERSINLITEKKDYLLSLAKPMILSFRNWKF